MTIPRGTLPHARPSAPAARGAFTLIELLVVIAIVGVLVSILAPALASARTAAKQTREMAAAAQLKVAFQLYADEHKGAILPGYPTDAMVSGRVLDHEGNALSGPPARRYPWRLVPYLDGNFEGLYFDPGLLSRYRSRTDFAYVVSISPSLGLNSAFVGGDSDRFGFNPAALRTLGAFYVTRIDQPRLPSGLLVFASARGVDPDGGSPVPGFFRVDAPYLDRRQWTGTYDDAAPPAATGFLHPRYFGKALASFFDGHVEMRSIGQFDDMRIWADRARSSTWKLGDK